MKRVLTILLLGLAAFAQSPQRGTYGGAAGKPPGTQGAVFAIPNAAGSQATTFEYLFDVTPAAVSITIQGCMRGTSTQPGNVGTCDAAADTYAGTTNSIRNPAFTKVYDTFLITIGTLSAGTTLTVNTTIVVSKAGTAGGAASGVASVSGAAPITSTGGANPTIGCATCNTSSAVLATNAVVLGANNDQSEKTTTSFTTNGTSTLTVGVAGSGNGVMALAGNTSGSATFTAPAVAGTSTNGVTLSNVLLAPDGNATTTAYSFTSAPTNGLYRNANNGGTVVLAAAFDTFAVKGSFGPVIRSDIPLMWSSTADVVGVISVDTSVNRCAAGVLCSGKTATANDSTGAFKGALYQTGTNCSAVGTAANPSVASCAAAAAGSFSCATNASTGTCTVNTTAVTVNSEIFITGRNDTTTGTRLGVTCNTGVTTSLPEISAVVAATSFTINLGTFTVNPECFSYFIVN